MNRARRWLLALVLVVASGCGGSSGPFGGKETTVAEPEMTAWEAFAALKKAGAELMGALAPDGHFSVIDTRRPVPCGGIGGAEYTKVHYEYSAGFRPEDTTTLFVDARAAMEELGLTVGRMQVTPAGEGLTFGGKGFGGKVMLHVEGGVLLQAQTGCLPNPEKRR